MKTIETERYTLVNGDCLEYMKTLPDGAVDAVITDPPYGTHDLGGGYGRRQLWSIDGRNGRKIENDIDLSMIDAAYPEFRRLVINGWAAVFYAARKTPQFVASTSSEEWFGNLVWDKAAPGLGYHIRYSHEDIAIFRLGSPHRPQDAIISVIRAPRVSKLHPHEKPPSLIRPIIDWVSSKGAVVLDPFMGSGTTGVACMQLGRRFIGCEIDPSYFDIAAKRIADAAAQPPLFTLDSSAEKDKQMGLFDEAAES